jgi:hypothetical protein
VGDRYAVRDPGPETVTVPDDANVSIITPDQASALLELGDRIREALDPDTMVCPVRDCPGHEGPHGSLLAETWTGDVES